MPRKRKIFYGWWIVLASATLNFFAGGTFVYGFTTFFNPIRNTFGWTAAATSIAFVLRRFEEGLLDVLAGFLVDKFGPRKLVIGGWIIFCLGFLLMSRINTLWQFYGTFLIAATGISFGSYIVFNTVLANWFVKKRSRAMTLLSLGMGTSGLLVPLIALSISQYGWRNSLVIIGIGMLVISMPIGVIFRHKPSQYGYLPDGESTATTSEPADRTVPHSLEGKAERDSGSKALDLTAKAALRTPAFWQLTLVFMFQHISTSAIMVHIVPFLESVEVPTTIAAMAVTGITLCSLIGRLCFGFLGDFTNKRYLLTIALALQTIGVFVFSFIAADKVWLIIPFLLTYAPGFGGTIPVRPALQADYFGTRSYGTIFGLMILISMLGSLFSPVIAGWIFDVTGSYRLAWQVFALITVPAIPLMLLAKPPKTQT